MCTLFTYSKITKCACFCYFSASRENESDRKSCQDTPTGGGKKEGLNEKAALWKRKCTVEECLSHAIVSDVLASLCHCSAQKLKILPVHYGTFHLNYMVHVV